MSPASLEVILRALQAAKVAFLVVGGIAVNAYSQRRLTVDLDLVVGLSKDNALAAVRALAELGYRPQVPVAFEDFADPEKRQVWIKDKDMLVFSLQSEEHKGTTVDLFVVEPFDFDSEYKLVPSRSVWVWLVQGRLA